MTGDMLARGYDVLQAQRDHKSLKEVMYYTMFLQEGPPMRPFVPAEHESEISSQECQRAVTE